METRVREVQNLRKNVQSSSPIFLFWADSFVSTRLESRIYNKELYFATDLIDFISNPILTSLPSLLWMKKSIWSLTMTSDHSIKEKSRNYYLWGLRNAQWFLPRKAPNLNPWTWMEKGNIRAKNIGVLPAEPK